LLEIPARTLDEPRWLAIGRIRLISVRRSRPEQIQLDEQF
jgi:hypothetical protein